MAFVKLDCGILNSTLWFERDVRDLFVTALLMAEPFELAEPIEQIKVRSLEGTGFFVPPGWYGFVPAAGVGIMARAQVEGEAGFIALEQLGSPEESSRTPDHAGRRMVRINGGYLILNYDKYRRKDHTSAARSARYRDAQAKRVKSRSDGVYATASHGVTSRSVTQAEAEAEAEAEAAQTNTKSAPAAVHGGGVVMSPSDYARLQKHNAYVGVRLRVPHKLHGDFVAALGGQDTDSRVRGWYASVDAEIDVSGEPITPDVWKWLDRRFKGWASEHAEDAEMAKFLAGEGA